MLYFGYKYRAEGYDINGYMYYSIPDDYRIITVQGEYIEAGSSEVDKILKSLGLLAILMAGEICQ